MRWVSLCKTREKLRKWYAYSVVTFHSTHSHFISNNQLFFCTSLSISAYFHIFVFNFFYSFCSISASLVLNDFTSMLVSLSKAMKVSPVVPDGALTEKWLQELVFSRVLQFWGEKRNILICSLRVSIINTRRKIIWFRIRQTKYTQWISTRSITTSCHLITPKVAPNCKLLRMFRRARGWRIARFPNNIIINQESLKLRLYLTLSLSTFQECLQQQRYVVHVRVLSY